MKAITVTVLLFLFANAASAADFVPYVQAKHRSNLFEHRSATSYEPTEDSICAGVEIRTHKFTFDICHGIVARDCGSFYGDSCKWKQGTEIAARWYPSKKGR